MIELIDFMMQHFLQDFIINMLFTLILTLKLIILIRNFIKIHFANKGNKFVNLPSVFKDKSVISSILTYFKNKEPMNCLKYNKPIRSNV